MIPKSIRKLLSAADARWRSMLLLKGILLALAALAGTLLLLCLADNLVSLPWVLRRAVFLGTLLGLGGWLVWKWIVPALRPAPPEALAIRVERANPGLENTIVNSVLLAEKEGDPMVELLLEKAEERARRADPGRVAPWSRVKRAGLGAAGLLALWALYLGLFPAQAKNALQRLRASDDTAPPLSSLALRVTPGDCLVLQGTDLEIRATAVNGPFPERAVLHLERKTGYASYPMEFDGGAFRHIVPAVKKPFSYYVEAGGTRTRAYRVRVAVPPFPEKITATFAYPAYTRMPPRADVPIQGPLDALKGTTATVRFRFNHPLESARVSFSGGKEVPLVEEDDRTWRFDIKIEKSGRYTLHLLDREGRKDRGDLSYAVRARDDLPPSVRIPLPGKDVFCSAGTSVAFEVDARDDVGLARVTLTAGTEKGEKTLAEWKASGREGRFNGVILPSRLGARPGDVIHYFAVATDLKGTRARSRLFTITVRTPEDERKRLAGELASLLERIKAILAKQIAAGRRNESLLAKMPRLRRSLWRAETRGLAEDQEGIRRDTLGVLADWTDPVLLRAPSRVLLEQVAGREMPRAVQVFLQASSRGRPVREDLVRGAGLQKVIENILRRVLAGGERLLALIREKGPEAALRRSTQRLHRSADTLEALAEKMKTFVEEQEKVVKATEAVRDVRPQDLTGEELKKLQELAATEQKWGGILMEAWNDLSKLYPQDFSNSRLCTELLEAYSEVELAEDALTRKAVTLAVPFEQSGLELAKSITENIERWLSDTHDFQKWVMEEPPGDYEVPMADLPEELEDLIGDLIDSEDAMSEDTEDVTSGWMDSLNEGAGWGASDGPISNMSAKGITGNMLPNSNEVGGRSGEGRTAKSSGQMVEKTATGKGGRRTPTRYTPDPFEAGEVKDKSSDPSSGSTGGGKLSGSNEQGLRGVPSPLLNRKMQRLASEQARIRQKAEKLDHKLKRRRFHVKDLAEAIRLMRAFEESLKKGLPADYAARRRAIADRLSTVRTIFEDRLRLQREGNLLLPRRAPGSIRSARAEEPPAEYRPLVEDYFRSLLEENR